MIKTALVLFNFPNINFIDKIVFLLNNQFSFQCEVIKLDSELNEFYSNDRRQYYSTKILEYALINYSNDYQKIIVLTEYDLYVPVLTFVFGEAQLNGLAAIVSSHRLYQEFYSYPENEIIIFERLQKEILHEIGHTFGLRHCHDWNCVMHSSLNIDEIDIKPLQFCNNCKLVIDNQI